MSAEAYVVQTTMGLDIAPTLANLKALADAYSGVLKTMQAIRDLQTQINGSLAGGANGFADGMARAAASAKAAAESAAQVSRTPPLMLPAPAWASLPPGSGDNRQGFSGQQNFVPPGGRDSTFNEPGTPIDLYNPTGNRPRYGDYMMAGYGVRALGGAASGLVDSSFMAAANADQLKQALVSQGFTKEQSDQAFATAIKTQQDVMGTFVGKNIGLVVQLMALTQDADTSIAMLPEMARAQQVFAGLGRDGDADISAAMKSGELRGILFENGKANLPAISHFLKNMEAVTAMSGGRYGPGDILQLLKSGGIAAGIMSDENGLAEMMPFIQAMTAARAGTALRAFGREFPGGRMNDAAFNTLVDMGLISHPELSQKVGLGYHQLLPGAMGQGDFDQATFHPEKFIMERLLPLAQAYDARKYGDSYNKGNDKERLAIETVTMGQIASMIPGGVFMAEMLRLAPLVSRDVKAFQGQAGGDAYKTSVEENPMMRMAALNAAIDAFKITLGNDNMAVSIATMKALTAALDSMNKVFLADPLLGSQLMLVADALKVIAPIVGAFLVAAPAVTAGKTIWEWASKSVPAVAAGAEGAAAGWLKAIPLLGEFFLVKDQVQHDLHDQTGLVNETKLLINGVEKMLGMGMTFHNYITLDGKVVAEAVTKHVVSGANGPLTGTGDRDGRRSYTPTEH